MKSVCVKIFIDRSDAVVAKSFLESCGIASRLSRDRGNSMRFNYMLEVSEADAEAARELLKGA
jgi:hypothetical protein